MNEEWWERPTCWICDYGWILLLLLLLGLLLFFTRSLWGPLVGMEPEPELGTGDIQVTLRWDGENDLDLHVIDPDGERIYYRNRESESGGVLDVDANAGCSQNMTNNPIENIFWAESIAPNGDFQIRIRYFKDCVPEVTTPFTVRLLVDGDEQTFDGLVSSAGEEVLISEFSR